MPDLDQFMLAKLAREMAMNIRDYKKIFEDFGIDEDDYYQIEKIPFFQTAKEQYALEWNSTLSTKERLSLSSAYIAEQIAPVLGARAMDPKEPLQAANDILKTMGKFSGVGEPKQQTANAAERFVITINLGADVDGKPVIEHFDKSIAIDANDIPQLAATSRNLPQQTHLTPREAALAALMEHD